MPHRARVAAADGRECASRGLPRGPPSHADSGGPSSASTAARSSSVASASIGRMSISARPRTRAGESRARSTRTAQALNSAVPDFGSEASIVSRFVATSSGKCSVMNTIPARSAVSMRAGAMTRPRRDTIATISPSAMPSRAASSGEMSSVSPKCSGDVVAARLHAGVVRLEPPPGGQHQGILRVRLFDRRIVMHDAERRRAAAARDLPQPAVQEGLARDAIRPGTATGCRRAPRAARSSCRPRNAARRRGTRSRRSSADRLAPVVAETLRDLRR